MKMTFKTSLFAAAAAIALSAGVAKAEIVIATAGPMTGAVYKGEADQQGRGQQLFPPRTDSAGEDGSSVGCESHGSQRHRAGKSHRAGNPA